MAMEAPAELADPPFLWESPRAVQLSPLGAEAEGAVRFRFWAARLCV